jgi:hypothetical protein
MEEDKKIEQNLDNSNEKLHISDVSDSSKNKQKLFDLLIKFRFDKTETDKYIIFKNCDEIFVFPNTELQERHYITTRYHLDMNGWMDKDDFNSVFDFLN